MKKIGEFKPDEAHIQMILGNVEAHHIKLRYALGMSFSGKRYNVYRDDKLSIQKECLDNKTYWFIDGDEREFDTVEKMLCALNEKLKSLNHDIQSIF
jgi:hypothetical protein